MSSVAATTAISPPRFDLKSLFIYFTAFAVLLVPVHWFGAGYLMNALFSAALVASCAIAYGNQHRVPAFLVAVFGAVVGCAVAIGFMIFAVHSVLNVVLCVALLIVGPRRRRFTMGLVGLLVVVYGFVFWAGAGEYGKLLALKTRYRFESLARRLQFERKPSPDDAAVKERIHLATTVAANLDDLEGRPANSYFSRAWALRELHQNTYEHFARAAGFGASRMPPLRYMLTEWQDRPPLVMPYSIKLSAPNTNGSELYAVHRDAVVDFASSDRTGYVRSRNAVAGFESHRLNATDESGPCGATAVAKWHVVRFELVSLLRHDEPRVYVAETMPAMDQLADVPHRALTEFEQGALPALAENEDVVFDAQPEHIQMLGAVRAGKRCLKCHEGSRGKLLGAFSYEMAPIQKPDQPNSQITQLR